MERRYLLVPQPDDGQSTRSTLIAQVANSIDDIRVSDDGIVRFSCEGFAMMYPTDESDRLRQVLESRLETDDETATTAAKAFLVTAKTMARYEARLILIGAGVWLVPIIEDSDGFVRLVPEGPFGPESVEG